VDPVVHQEKPDQEVLKDPMEIAEKLVKLVYREQLDPLDQLENLEIKDKRVQSEILVTLVPVVHQDLQDLKVNWDQLDNQVQLEDQD